MPPGIRTANAPEAAVVTAILAVAQAAANATSENGLLTDIASALRAEVGCRSCTWLRSADDGSGWETAAATGSPQLLGRALPGNVPAPDEIELDYDTLEGRAWNPRLRFFDTTVLASPYLSFPLEHRRKTGLLTPYYSQGSQRGFETGIPFYWNIAPEVDATLTPVFMAKRGEQLKTQGRYLQRSYAGEVKLEYLPNDEELGISRRALIYKLHKHKLIEA